MPKAAPATSSHNGIFRPLPSRSITMTISAITTKTARNTTPQVMTDPKLVSSSAKRSGLWNPAVASTIRRTRPTMTHRGADHAPVADDVHAFGLFDPQVGGCRKGRPAQACKEEVGADYRAPYRFERHIHHLT